MLPVEKHLAIMEKEEIDKTVLFSTAIHPENTTNYSDYKKELVTLFKIVRGEINPIEAKLKAIKELKEITTTYPDKFIGFGFCPVNLTLLDTEKYITDNIIENSFKGIGEFTLATGQVKTTENIFKSISSYSTLPLWFHTFNPFTLTDILELLSLSKKYPEVTVIFGHGAGSYWLDVIEEMAVLKNVYFDISASFSTHSIKVASELMPERVLFSVDMPYNSPRVMKTLIEESVGDLSVRKLIFGENIRNLLKI